MHTYSTPADPSALPRPADSQRSRLTALVQSLESAAEREAFIWAASLYVPNAALPPRYGEALARLNTARAALLDALPLDTVAEREGVAR